MFKLIQKDIQTYVYNMYTMRQSTCLLVSPINVYSHGCLFNCMTVGQASDSTTTLTLNIHRWDGRGSGLRLNDDPDIKHSSVGWA